MTGCGIYTKRFSNFNNFTLSGRLKEKRGKGTNGLGRKERYVLTEVGIFLAREGPRLVKKLQNWFAIKHGSEISWLLESTKVEGNLLGRLERLIIWLKIFQVPLILFFKVFNFTS